MKTPLLIDKTEVKKLLKSFGFETTDEELDALMKSIDQDGNGQIDFDEFLSFMTTKSSDADFEAELRKAFELLDHNGNGSISAEEIYNGYLKDMLTMEECIFESKLITPIVSQSHRVTKFCDTSLDSLNHFLEFSDSF